MRAWPPPELLPSRAAVDAALRRHAAAESEACLFFSTLAARYEGGAAQAFAVMLATVDKLIDNPPSSWEWDNSPLLKP